MKLRKKTLLIIGGTLALLIVLLYATSSVILTKGFARVEEQDTQKNVQRVMEAISDDVSALNGVAGDWAAWDETYSFIDDGDLDYVKRNIPDTTFVDIRLDVMVFVNSSGGIVFERGFDAKNGKEIPVQESLHRYLSRDNLILQHQGNESVKGIVLLPEGPMLIVSSPITDNKRIAPVRGSMIWGRYLNDEELQRLAGITHLSLSMRRFDDAQMPFDFQAARSSLSQKTPILVQPLSEATIAGYAILDDVYGNPALLLKVDMPRDIYMQGKATMHYFILSLLAIGLVFGAVTLLLLEKSVLSRLAWLSNNVGRIGRSGNLSERVSMTGEDELSSLANDINGMLGSLEKSQEKLYKSEIKNRVILNAIPDLILQLRKDGTIINYKATKDDNPLIPPGEFSGKKIHDIIPSELSSQIAFYLDRVFVTGYMELFDFQIQRNVKKYDYEARFVANGEDEVLVIFRDITERRQAEEAKKNEMLLKEIHHRIKNNLQVISSLLYLQSKDIKDKDVLEMFKESQNRVKSMALAHEKLYRSKDAGRVDTGEYIKDLADYLFQSYSIDSKVIRLNIKAENILLGIDVAIPCGFIINELITNSLKHAFPDGRKGELCIDFHSENNKFILVVGDNGIGIPEKLDFRNPETLGLRLVTSLVEQIRGNIELDRSNGAKFKIIFKELNYNEGK